MIGQPSLLDGASNVFTVQTKLAGVHCLPFQSCLVSIYTSPRRSLYGRLHHPPLQLLPSHNFNHPIHQQRLPSPPHPPSPFSLSKEHHRLQAGDLLLILGEHIGHDGVFPGGHLAGDLDLVRHAHGALVERAVQVDVDDLVAEVGCLPDQRDEAVFDG